MRRFASTLVITLLAVAMPTRGEALTLSEWEQTGQAVREGYVLAIMEYMGTFVDSDDQSSIDSAIAYQKCFHENKFNSTSAAKLVGRYILMNPKASTVPMLVNVVSALGEACSGYFPKGKN